CGEVLAADPGGLAHDARGRPRPRRSRMTRGIPMLLALAAAAGLLVAAPQPAADADPLKNPKEVHLKNVRQLTFGGENAEAYWSPDGKKLIFQSKRDGRACDQIYVMDAD